MTYALTMMSRMSSSMSFSSAGIHCRPHIWVKTNAFPAGMYASQGARTTHIKVDEVARVESHHQAMFAPSVTLKPFGQPAVTMLFLLYFLDSTLQSLGMMRVDTQLHLTQWIVYW